MIEVRKNQKYKGKRIVTVVNIWYLGFEPMEVEIRDELGEITIYKYDYFIELIKNKKITRVI